MTKLLHPVGDGAGFGDIQIVGSDGVERFSVLTPILDDDFHVAITAEQGRVIDQKMQRRGPIAFGDCVVRGRFARVAGDGGIELSIGLWGIDPRSAVSGSGLIAQTNSFQVWQEEWIEHAIPLIGRQADRVASQMGDLWIRVVVINAVDGAEIPTIGVSSLWLEVPDPADDVTFQDPTLSPPPDDTLVAVRTFGGRSGTAKKVDGEWFDEGDQPFEIDSKSLPLGPDGLPQVSRAVNGWGS